LKRLGFRLYPFVDLFAVDSDARGRREAKAQLIALHAEDGA